MSLARLGGRLGSVADVFGMGIVSVDVDILSPSLVIFRERSRWPAPGREHTSRDIRALDPAIMPELQP